MSGTLVSKLGKAVSDTLLSDGIGEVDVIGYAVVALGFAAMFWASQYRFCQDAPAGLVRNCWNSPKSRTVLPAASAPVQMKPLSWWPGPSASGSELRMYGPAGAWVAAGLSAWRGP